MVDVFGAVAIRQPHNMHIAPGVECHERVVFVAAEMSVVRNVAALAVGCAAGVELSSPQPDRNIASMAAAAKPKAERAPTQRPIRFNGGTFMFLSVRCKNRPDKPRRMRVISRA